MGETFGKNLRSHRLQIGLGLRAFALAAGMEPSELSNLEHGRLAPPREKGALDTLADLLKLKRGSPERTHLFDLAVAAREHAPADVAALAPRTRRIRASSGTQSARGGDPLELMGQWLATWMDLRVALGTVIAIEGDFPQRHVMVGGALLAETPQLGLWVRIETISEVGGREWLGALPEGVTERPVQLIRWEVIKNAYLFPRPMTAAQVMIGFRTP
jgi:transcriptional regulator with XRE-family HTH domain